MSSSFHKCCVNKLNVFYLWNRTELRVRPVPPDATSRRAWAEVRRFSCKYMGDRTRGQGIGGRSQGPSVQLLLSRTRGPGREGLGGRHSAARGLFWDLPELPACSSLIFSLTSFSCVLGTSGTGFFPAPCHHGSLAGRGVTDAGGPLSTNSTREAGISRRPGLALGPVSAVLAHAGHALRSWSRSRKVSVDGGNGQPFHLPPHFGLRAYSPLWKGPGEGRGCGEEVRCSERCVEVWDLSQGWRLGLELSSVCGEPGGCAELSAEQGRR